MKHFLLLLPLLSLACSSTPAKFPESCVGDVPGLLGQVGVILLKEPDPKNLSVEAKDALAELGAKHGHDVVLCLVKTMIRKDAE